MLTLYSAKGSGGIAVEAALTLAGVPYDLIDSYTWDEDDKASGDKVLAANPMRQVPALVLDGGEVLTESAAILIWIAEQYPQVRLAPAVGDPMRGQFLRWMSFVSASVYGHYWAKDDPRRLGVAGEAVGVVEHALLERIAECWGMMAAQVMPGRYLLGDELSVLDLYVAVVSRFRPRRKRFYAKAPTMADVVRRVDAEPRLAAFWAERMPFEGRWEG
ncbi:MAG TPA: glutathione S-transferase family protein [Phenylobacterium sp.]|nr:glutathione S-transferase family protein [Phenylobacterium sp.]